MKNFIYISFLLLFQNVYGGTNEIVIDKEIQDISAEVEYYIDADCSLDIEHLDGATFTPSEKMINLGVTDACVWVKIRLINRTDQEDLLLMLEHPILDRVSFFNDSALIEEISEQQPFYARSYDDPNFLFELNLPPNEKRDYFLKIYGSELVVIPISVGNAEKILSISTLKEMLFGIYAGIILVMFFYNIFVYFSVRDSSYLYYVIYILLIGLTQASLKGFTSKYLWPGSEYMMHHGATLLSSLVGIAAIEFVKVFLHSKEYELILHRISYAINALFVASIAICLYGNIQLSFTIMQLATFVGSIYAFILAVRIWRKGYRPAKFFLIAWSILLIGAVIFVMKDFELVPFNIFTNYSLQMASILEVVLLSFALADKINILRREKEESQMAAMSALEENERIVREQNVILEAKVEERTAALKKANDDLNKAMVELKNAQSQLVSQEKMASLGQLTAGIAHEINNPINFVKSSVKPLKDNVAEILELVEEYEANLKRLNNEEANKSIIEFKEKIQFDYLLEETQDVIENIQEGANRTVEIVSGLRTFSHVDDLGLKQTDLNKGIKSTLNLLIGEIPDYLDVRLNLTELKDVECYGGKMNQVFMNVINNAIQAIKSKGEGKGLINIHSVDMGDHVRITIEDNGIGMDPETQEKIFDPFFTTKDVGEGTGLGLSVVYGIIESHHGSIDVTSELGKGSSFVINLPYIQPK